jgi:hypothetical protein
MDRPSAVRFISLTIFGPEGRFYLYNLRKSRHYNP